MGEILKEVEAHLVEVAERVADLINDGELDGTDEWEINAITIITGRNKNEDNQFHNVTHSKGVSIPELIGTLEMVKAGIIKEALSDE